MGRVFTNHMGNYRTSRGKRSLSAHQKQIRFFVRLSVVICTLLVAVLFWLLSRPSFMPH
jgi:hypothetical protein